MHSIEKEKKIQHKQLENKYPFILHENHITKEETKMREINISPHSIVPELLFEANHLLKNKSQKVNKQIKPKIGRKHNRFKIIKLRDTKWDVQNTEANPIKTQI